MYRLSALFFSLSSISSLLSCASVEKFSRLPTAGFWVDVEYGTIVRQGYCRRIVGIMNTKKIRIVQRKVNWKYRKIFLRKLIAV